MIHSFEVDPVQLSVLININMSVILLFLQLSLTVMAMNYLHFFFDFGKNPRGSIKKNNIMFLSQIMLTENRGPRVSKLQLIIWSGTYVFAQAIVATCSPNSKRAYHSRIL